METPSFVARHPNGVVKWKVWVGDNGRWHRDDGPAIEVFDTMGRLVEQKFLVDGKPHNENGPAWARYDESGAVCAASFFVKGKPVVRA
jgi:hypothetical protein